MTGSRSSTRAGLPDSDVAAGRCSKLASFSSDAATPDASYFAESNKDIDNVSTWQCGVQNNPLNKDDILNAYAALFKNTANNHVILYAGGERDSNNGNSFMGFWIFKGNVGCNPPGNFTGQHTDGDVLILSNFTGGGGTPLVQVYEWYERWSGTPRLRRLL